MHTTAFTNSYVAATLDISNTFLAHAHYNSAISKQYVNSCNKNVLQLHAISSFLDYYTQQIAVHYCSCKICSTLAHKFTACAQNCTTIQQLFVVATAFIAAHKNVLCADHNWYVQNSKKHNFKCTYTNTVVLELTNALQSIKQTAQLFA